MKATDAMCRSSRFVTALYLCFVVCSGRGEQAPRESKGRLKVFVLAGQSNMVGAGAIKAHPSSTNRGKGTLEYLVRDPLYADRYGHLVDERGDWIVRDDVRIVFGDRRGGLSVGYGGSTGQIGPEFQFGHVIGDYLEDQVLLIKCAWGGKSLGRDFRPPSAGGDVGAYYTLTINRVKEVLGDVGAHVPDYDGRGYELTGFGWHQGWNDRINQAFTEEYESNLAHFIRDIRKDLGVPGLPFVIAETGMGGLNEKHARSLALMEAQAAGVQREEFRGNAAFVSTRPFWREQEVSPSGQGYHWNCNAETYCLIGEGMAEAMIELLAVPVRDSVLESLSEARDAQERVALCRKLMADNPRDSGIQSVCLEQLVATLGTRALGDLVAGMGHENRWVRKLARKLAVGVPGEHMTRELAEQLGTDDGTTRAGILRVLTERGDTAALPAVKGLLNDESESVRIAAVRVLGAMGGADAMPLLANATRDRSAGVRATAFSLLTSSAAPQATDVLLALADQAKDSDLHAEVVQSCLRRLAEGAVDNARRPTVLKSLLAVARRRDQKLLVLEELKRVPSIEVLRLTQPLLQDAELREDAAVVAVAIAEGLKMEEEDEKTAAVQILEEVMELSENKDTRSAAETFVYKHKRPDIDDVLDLGL